MESAYRLADIYPKSIEPYVHTGRGGAGNVTRNWPSAAPTHYTTHKNLCFIQSQEPYPMPNNLSSISTRPSQRKAHIFGRGGFGNSHPASEQAMFSFDEELERVRKVTEAMVPIYHIGRGGHGNTTYSAASSTRNSCASSTNSDRGFRSSLERVKIHFSRLNGMS